MTFDKWGPTIALSLLAVGAGLSLWWEQGGLQAPAGSAATASKAPASGRYCTAIRGEPEDRLDTCLMELAGRSTVSAEALANIDDLGAANTLWIGGEPAGAMTWDDVPGLRAALVDDDEAAAAAAARDAGVLGLVVSRHLTGALDRTDKVLARLAYLDHLDWFQIRYIANDRIVFSVRRTTKRVPDAAGADLLAGLRARLAGRAPTAQAWQPSKIRLLATLRLQGSTLVLRHASGRNVEQVLDQLAAKMIKRWERDREPEGFGTLADRLGDLRLEVHVVMDRAPIEPRGRADLANLWELGVDGFMLRAPEGAREERFTYFPGSELVTQSIKTPDAFLQAGTKRFDWPTARPWEDPATRLELIRTQHFMERAPGGDGGVVRLVRGEPEVTMDELTDEHVRDMLLDGAEWWLRNMNPDGSILYKYWPTQNRRSTEYNEVRHILAARDLADAYRWRHDPRYLEGSRRAMAWLSRYEVNPEDPADPRLPSPPEGTVLFRYPPAQTATREPNQKLGTVAVGLLGWIAYAKASGDHTQDDLIRRMGRFVLHMLEDNGKFDPYFVQPGHSYYGQKNDIVPGEAALALGKVAEYFDEADWLAFMPKYLDFYEGWWRARAARVLPTGRWPHNTYTNETRLDLVQFGPWTVMATKQYWLLTGDDRAATFGLEIADWMIDSYQWDGERSPWPDYVGGYYKMPGELPAMQTFCYSEGTAAAYHIASRFAPERKGKYERSTREALRFLRLMQFDDVDSYFAPRVDIVHGGVKYAMNENKIRIDYVGHGLSTVTQYLDARAFDPAVALTAQALEPDDPAYVPWGTPIPENP